MKTILLTLTLFLSSCYGTYYISDAEYSDLREEHASITYYQGNIYWGWHSGYYYYYGKPHYYPWYYYYNACPPSHHNTTTHIVINRPVNKPRPSWNKPTYKPGGNVKVNVNRTNVKTNTNKNNKVIVKPNRNRNNNKVNVKRKPR
jgi:PBP1b-binding outer membrane lipoprotein LpoB